MFLFLKKMIHAKTSSSACAHSHPTSNQDFFHYGLSSHPTLMLSQKADRALLTGPRDHHGKEHHHKDRVL